MGIEAAQSIDGRRLKRRLYAAFIGIVSSLVVAVAVSLYATNRLNSEMVRTSDEVMPGMLSAMRLSEHGALLVASLQGLVGSKSDEALALRWREIEQLLGEFHITIELLDHTVKVSAQGSALEQDVTQLTDILLQLRDRVGLGIELKRLQQQSMEQVRRLHSDLVDTVSPVIYGISSLSKLFARQDSRKFSANIKVLFTDYLTPYTDLLINNSRLWRSLGRLVK